MQSYSSKSDIWSVGMVAFQLLTGRFPFCENIRTCTLQARPTPPPAHIIARATSPLPCTHMPHVLPSCLRSLTDL